MAIFSYTGLDSMGKELTGTVEADNEKDVVRILREQGVTVIKVREGSFGAEGGLKARLGMLRELLSIKRYTPVGSADLVAFFRQTSLMLRSGYTLVAALDAGNTMTPKLWLRRAIGRMCDAIRKGASFSAMLAEEKRIFSPLVASLIASGEKSGNLDDILDRLADSLERSKEVKRQLLAAMFYPMFVLLAAIGVIVFLVVGVIPKFASVMAARKASLPASTQMLMNVSTWMQDYGAMLGIVLGVSIFLILAACTTRPGKRVVDRVLLYVPVVGGAVQYAAMAQAGWCLAMLLRSGVTALESIRVTSSVTGNLIIGESFQAAAEGLLQGRPLSKTFEQPHIPLMMRHMAAVGESSGQLDTVMNSAGEYYQKELSAKVKLIAVAIEPVMIVGVGGIVGFVYYSFFQAMLSASKGGM